MPWPDSWGRRQRLIIQASLVDSDSTGFSAVISRSNLDDSVVDPSGPNSARVDGGDIRFSTDEAGANPAACDVVEFGYDSATGAGDAAVKIIVSVDVLAAVDVPLWMWFANPAATQPVPSSALGAHNSYDVNHVSLYPGVYGSIPSATSLWMIDPKAVTHNGATYYTWLDSLTTSIRISKYTHATGQWEQEQTVATPSGVDAHQAPSILVDSTGFIWVFWGDYTNAPNAVRYCKSTSSENITSWDAAAVAATGTRCTYPSAVQLSSGNIVLYYRDGTTATDVRRVVYNGTSWVNNQQILLSAGSDRPYYLVSLGQSDRVHLAYHWYSGNHRDLYYAYSDNADAVVSAWSSADGSALSMPMAQNAAQLVFNSDIAWDTGYLGGLSIGPANQPHIAFSVTDAVATNLLLHYTYSGGTWSSSTIVADNGIEVTGYAAGVIDCDINADDNSAIQAIVCVSVSGIYEVLEYATIDGASWSLSRTVTSSSSRNNRCVGYAAPVNDQCRAVWQYTDALHYNTGRADHHFLSSNNDFIASWVDFLTQTTTTTRDRTRNHKDLTATGTPTQVTGQIGSAFDFNGTSEYFSASSNYPTTEGITLSCLLNTDNAGLNQNPIGLGNNGSSGHFRQMLVSGGGIRAQKQNDGGTAGNANTANALTAASWHHAVVTFTSDSRRDAYLDMDVLSKGVDVGFVTSPSIDFVSFGALLRGSTAQYFNGRIEHVRIADIVYSEGRLTAEFNNTSTPAAFILFDAPVNVAGTAPINNAMDFRWDSAQEALSQNDLRWGILNSISNNAQSIWNLLDNASNTASLQWGIYSEVSNALQSIWDILSAITPISNSTDVQWGISQVASNNTNLRWDVLSSILNLLDMRWNAFENVSQQTDTRWNAFENVSNVNNIQWDIYSEVNSALQIIYDLLASVENTSDAQWHLFAETSNTLQNIWDIISSLSSVGNVIDLRWNAIGRVSQLMDARWGVLNSAANQLDSRWDALNELGVSNDLRWDILKEVSQQITAQWDLFSDVSATFDVRWDSAGRVGNAVSIRWNILTLQGILPLEVIVIPAQGRIIITK